ncbi:MAG: 1-deoxy-D-xylulose-5-phosphate reductoisomerase, partial [Deltaproteobacteria bacterium]|nr:1-deoxy-D-xylulose-5-phosphate reductoisomerase [Deltaproteobacteria bacterium]
MTEPLKLAILGATGSIGRQALSLAATWPERIKVVGLAAAVSVEPLAKAVAKFKPNLVSVLGEPEAQKLASLLNDLGVKSDVRPEIVTGSEGAIKVA